MQKLEDTLQEALIPEDHLLKDILLNSETLNRTYQDQQDISDAFNRPDMDPWVTDDAEKPSKSQFDKSSNQTSLLLFHLSPLSQKTLTAPLRRLDVRIQKIQESAKVFEEHRFRDRLVNKWYELDWWAE